MDEIAEKIGLASAGVGTDSRFALEDQVTVGFPFTEVKDPVGSGGIVLQTEDRAVTVRVRGCLAVYTQPNNPLRSLCG